MRKRTRVLVISLMVISAVYFYLFLTKQYIRPIAPPQEEPVDFGKAALDRLQYAQLCFDSLLAWQSGDTNAFYRIINSKGYDTFLRSAVQRSIKTGKGSEVPRWINLVIDCYMAVEASHFRTSDWPDHEAEPLQWALVSQIYTNRQIHPYDADDEDVAQSIQEILNRTQRPEHHKGDL